jgi:hypothetical protein
VNVTVKEIQQFLRVVGSFLPFHAAKNITLLRGSSSKQMMP